MMKFTTYLELLEDLPVGSEHNKIIWFDYLKKYKGDKDLDKLFGSFVFVDKVGVNPNTPFETPIGVYAYPLKYIFVEESVPFRGSNKPKKIKVLKSKSEPNDHNVCLNDSLPNSEYKKKIEYIKTKYAVDSKFIEKCEKNASKKTNFEKLWNITRIISLGGFDKESSKETISKWTKILLDLGYEYICDNGSGVIHPKEPTQTVFINPKSYSVIDEEFVDTEEKFKSTQSKEVNEFVEEIGKGWNSNIIKKLVNDKKVRYLFILDKNDNDALKYSILSSDLKSFETILKYFLKDGVLKDFANYLNSSLSKIKSNGDIDSDDSKILDQLVLLNDMDMYNDKKTNPWKLLKYLESGKSDLENLDKIASKLKTTLEK